MGDAYVQIEITDGSQSRLSKALREMSANEPDFPSARNSINHGWWHKPPDNARAILARCLSRHELSGRLSVELHDGIAAWDVPPPPRWTGFTARSM